MAIKKQNTFPCREISEFSVDSREKNAVLGNLGPRLGPVALRPGGYKASRRLDRAGYPAWPLYTLTTINTKRADNV